jgi:putative nucleotidyltransferase with HDIG domain
VSGPAEISRQAAWELVCQWTESDSLRRHMLAVEAAMRAYAPRFDGDVELWGLTGLLHDLDYERYPDLDDGHPRYAMRELSERGYPEELVRAVASHADFLEVARQTAMEKALYAVDELSGFILACAYVRPERLQRRSCGSRALPPPSGVRSCAKGPRISASTSTSTSSS